MKYKVDILIEKPIDEVVEKFSDRSNDKLWMKGFVKKTQISGEEGEEGAKCKVEFEMGKRRVEMIEEITNKNLPDDYTTTYTTDKVFNIVKSSF